MSALRRRETFPQLLSPAAPSKPVKKSKLSDNDIWTRYIQPKIDFQAVCRAVDSHKSFELQAGHTVHNLPNFGHLAPPYGNLTDVEEDEMCKQEAFRLVRIGNSESPVKSQGKEDMQGQADRDGYYRLHWLGLRQIQALRICEHDVYVILAENVNLDSDYLSCVGTQAKLLNDFNPLTGEEHFAGNQQLEGETFDRCNHAVVNYLTGMLIKVILQCFRGDYWVHGIIAAVARISANMKLIGRDLPGAVDQTLQNGNHSRTRIAQRERRNQEYRPKDLEDILPNNADAEKPHMGHAGQARKYFWEMKTTYGAVINMLIESLAAFAVSNP
ncbi:hypothetical protein CSUB01_10994 [Colletotrichum sublineola]|uniref:Uncharacterized protein n=1 Tax=Colletotrichum sublineola TaxID=1173701 RepID=A0A066Y0V7_COLSU|nr:hypothetical protein CSUB01_10994 [Colletotrichum sublineola]